MRLALALAALGLIAVSFAVFSLATHGTASAATTTIDAGNYYFCGDDDQGHVCETDIAAGDTVTWSVEEGSHHIVQCTDSTFATCTGGFDSGTKAAGSTFSQTFNAAGTIYYHCAFHPTEMMGKLVIAAAETATPTATAAPTSAATGTPTPKPTTAALPQTGGPAGDGGSNIWMYLALAIGGVLLIGSAATFAVARKRS